MRYRGKQDGGKRSLIREQAFTLVELLVVIAIIALLLSILMPALSKVRAQGKKVACQSNVRQMGVASEMYSNENDDSLVCFQRYITADEQYVWANDLEPYLSGKGKTFTNIKAITGGSTYDKILSVFKCPAQRERYNQAIGEPAIPQSFQGALSWRIRFGINLNYSTYDNSPILVIVKKRSKVTSPAGRLFIADSTDNTNKYFADIPFPIDARILPAWRHMLSNCWWESAYYIPIADRHMTNSDILMLDGHVTTMNYNDVEYLMDDTDSVRAQKERLWGYRK